MKLKYLGLFVGLFMLLFTGCKQSDEVSLKFEKYTLANGLEVILHEDKSDPIVSVAIQYHVGSAREKVGKTGFAHFFEHMLFQRSEHLPRNAFFKKIGEMGGSFNGSTGQDGTNYYETVPRDALEKVLWMESDRMGFFINTVSEGGLKREIDVVSNEKRQGENSPYGQSYALMSKYFYPEGHPYSWPVIGSIQDLRSATIEDVKAFYNTYYTPNNATLVIAGDFDKAEVKRLVEKYFGEIKSREKVEPFKPMPVVLDSTMKLVYEDKFATAAALEIEFPSVEQFHPDSYPLRLMALLMSYGKNSPFYQVLVQDKKLVSRAMVGSASAEISGTVGISLTALKDVNLNDVYAATQEALAKFEKDGVAQADLDRFITMQETMVYNMLTTLEGKSLAMARNNVFAGRPDQMLEDLKHYQAVTIDDINRVYNTYMKGKNFVALSTVPAGKPELALAGSTVAEIANESIAEQTMNSQAGAVVEDSYEYTPSAIDRSIEPPFMANTPALNIPTIWKGELSNGMKLRGTAYTELPVLNFSLILNQGSLCDPQGKVGIAEMTASLLNNGTATKTPEELEAALGQLGARLAFSASTESMGLYGTCLKKNFNAVMALVQEMLLTPRWDEKVLEVSKMRAINSIYQNATEPKIIAANAFSKLLYGRGSVLANQSFENEDQVKSITMDDLKAFYAANISPTQSTFNFVGSLPQAEVERELAPLVKAWEAKELPTPVIHVNVERPEAKIYFVNYPGAKQSYILLGSPAMPRANAAYYPARIANYLLGASASGLLFDVLRLQRGYTYGAYSSFRCGNYSNIFRATSSVQATVTKESADLFKELIGGYGAAYTDEMLLKTRDALVRGGAAEFEEPDARLGMLDDIAVYNLPEDYLKQEEAVLKSITVDQLKAVMAEWINYDAMTFVIVGDAKTQLPQLKKAGLGAIVQIDHNGIPVK